VFLGADIDRVRDSPNPGGGPSEIVSWYRDRDISVRLFDASTDVSIPTVLCVVDAPHDPRVSQNIGSASGFDLGGSMLKAVLEATCVYAALAQPDRIPRRYRDYTAVMQVAANMARPSRRKAFGFLLDGLEERTSTRPSTRTFTSPEDELGHVLDLFRTRGMEVYAVDVTPREAETIGYTVVQVLVPALQPASLDPSVQYRGHARLRHDHPAATARPRLRDLNRWPVPLA
jgi:ribosomal protein S12 methylthiotransferase accessory factor